MRRFCLIILIFGYNGVQIGYSQSTIYESKRSPCGEIFNTKYGTIDYRDYPNNAHCSWTIQSSDPDDRILIKFEGPFITEKDFDYLLITQNVDVEGQSKQYNLTGHHNYDEILLRANNVTLEFISDHNVTELGFKLNYKFIQDSNIIPCGMVMQNYIGILDHSFFPNNENCTWTIQSKNEYDQIKITFEDEFYLENDEFLTAIDANSGNVQFNLTGYNKPNETFILDSNKILINYQADPSIFNPKLFTLKFRIIRDMMDCCLPDSNRSCRDGTYSRENNHCGFGPCLFDGYRMDKVAGCGGCWGGCRVEKQGNWSANLFKDPYFKREIGLVWGNTDTTCVDLKSHFGDDKTNTLSSINTWGHCVYIYSGHNCTGSFVEVKPDGLKGTLLHSNLADYNFNDITKSISSCKYIQPIVKANHLQEELIFSEETVTQNIANVPETTLKSLNLFVSETLINVYSFILDQIITMRLSF